MATGTVMFNGNPILTLRELLGPSLRAVFIGFNPAPDSVAAGHYYRGRHGRTLWGRLDRYGILPNAPKGAEDDHAFRLGFGFADLVRRLTASIDQISRFELRDAIGSLTKRLYAAGGKPLIVFTYVGLWKLAGTALEQAGHRVVRMPHAYEAPDAKMKELLAVLGILPGAAPST